MQILPCRCIREPRPERVVDELIDHASRDLIATGEQVRELRRVRDRVNRAVELDPGIRFDRDVLLVSRAPHAEAVEREQRTSRGIDRAVATRTIQIRRSIVRRIPLEPARESSTSGSKVSSGR